MTAFLTWKNHITGGISERTFPDRLADFVKVNEFYPPLAGSGIHNGKSNPISNYFGSLAAAQEVYPFASSLTNETDWCAWQAALLYIYENQIVIGSSNGGTLWADGNYVCDQTITSNVGSITVIGKSYGGGYSTSIKYTGVAGTLAAPIYIMDFWTIAEDRVTYGTQPGSRTASTCLWGPVVTVKNITFVGHGGDMTANSVSVSNFISGIRLRYGSWGNISHCWFSGTLWDEIVATGARMFDVIEHNEFFGVHRDGISYRSINGNFSTAMWIRYNEFYAVGRYAILLDLNGSVEPNPRIIGNDFEQAYVSFFVLNPQWFVQGVVAGMCIINGGNLSWRDNRTEDISLTAGFLGELHLVACQNPAIRDGTLHKVICTAFTKTSRQTSALASFVSTNKYGDITDQQNFNCGSSTNFGAVNDTPSFSNIYNLQQLIVADSTGLSNADPISVDAIYFEIVSFPVMSGTYAALINPAGASSAALGSLSWSDGIVTATTASAHGLTGLNYLVIAGAVPNGYNGVSLCTVTGTKTFTYPSSNPGTETTPGTYGLVGLLTPNDYAISGHALGLTENTSTNSTAGNVAHPTTVYGRWGNIIEARQNPIDQVLELNLFDGNNYFWRTGNGTLTGTSSATWAGYRSWTLNRLLGDLTQTAANFLDLPFLFGNITNSSGNHVTYVELAGAVATTRKVRYNFSDPPASGAWNVGDIVYNNAPTAGGYIGWVCVTAGTPGTWKTFGAISS